MTDRTLAIADEDDLIVTVSEADLTTVLAHAVASFDGLDTDEAEAMGMTRHEADELRLRVAAVLAAVNGEPT